MAGLEFERAYYDSAVYRVNHYTTRTPHEKKLINLRKKLIIFTKNKGGIVYFQYCIGFTVSTVVLKV